MAEDTQTTTTTARGRAKAAGDTSASATLPIPAGHVRVRVTKNGDRKIHKGTTARTEAATNGAFDTNRFADPNDDYEIFPTYRWKDEFTLPLRIAKAQEDNGFVEIQEDEV